MSLLNDVFGSPGIGAATNAAQGLIGQSYQNQLEQQMLDMRAQQYNTALANSMMQTKNAMAQNIYNTKAHHQAIKPFNPNEQEAYKIPLSNLVTLWQAKYGDTWVEKPDEDFWMDALTRLNVAGKLEHAGGWYRIKEDA